MKPTVVNLFKAGGFAAARSDGSYDIAVNTLERDTRADFIFPLGNSPSGSCYTPDQGATRRHKAPFAGI